VTVRPFGCAADRARSGHGPERERFYRESAGQPVDRLVTCG
jgi:hypothetical protein